MIILVMMLIILMIITILTHNTQYIVDIINIVIGHARKTRGVAQETRAVAQTRRARGTRVPCHHLSPAVRSVIRCHMPLPDPEARLEIICNNMFICLSSQKVHLVNLEPYHPEMSSSRLCLDASAVPWRITNMILY